MEADEKLCTRAAIKEAGLESAGLADEDIEKLWNAIAKQVRSGRFGSLPAFLLTYRPPPWELLPDASQQTSFVGSAQPLSVVPWSTFENDCWALLDSLPEGGPVVMTRPALESKAGNEAELLDQLLHHLLAPLQEAVGTVDPFFKYTPARSDMKGLSGGLVRPDLLLTTQILEEEEEEVLLLVSIEVKTSRVLCVQHDTSLPAVYAAAAAAVAAAAESRDEPQPSAASRIVNAVKQLHSHLETVPFGVLLTDQQLFCMQRRGGELLCSPGVPLAGSVQCPVQRGSQRASSAAEQVLVEGSLTAVAALYCLTRMSQQWWLQQPQPSGMPVGSGSGGGALGSGGGAAGLLSPTAAAESEWCTSQQLFPGCSFDPRVPGGVPRSLGASCMGAVLQGAVGGRPAAVKLVDLWRGPEGKEVMQHEVQIYRKLQPLQGAYVPHLLGHGYCDGWKYFLATSLEGPSLDSDKGWALGEEAICAAAFAALDAVHRCGVLHGDIALRNFVLAHQPAAVAGGTAGGGGEGAGGGGASDTSPKPQHEPRVMLLDFGYAQLVSEAAAGESGEEPAVCFQQERWELEDLLGWGPPPHPHPHQGDANSGADAAAAVGSRRSSDAGDQQQQPGQQGLSDAYAASGGPAAPSAPAALRGSRSPTSPAGFSSMPPPPPQLSRGRTGWRQQQLRSPVPRNRLFPAAVGSRSGASRLSSLRTRV